MNLEKVNISIKIESKTEECCIKDGTPWKTKWEDQDFENDFILKLRREFKKE